MSDLLDGKAKSDSEGGQNRAAAHAAAFAFAVLAECDGGDPSLVPPYLDKELKQSLARSTASWTNVGVDATKAAELAESSVGDHTKDIKERMNASLVAITGPLGSGKTLTLERCFQAAIADRIAETSRPLPIYLKAGRVEDLNDLVQHTQEALSLRDEPCALFVDGLDEVGPLKAQRILNDIRVLLALRSDSYAIIAARPMPMLESTAQFGIPALSEEEACGLIHSTTGLSFQLQFSRLPPTVRSAASRPLFAVLLGRYYADHRGHLPRSTASLVSHLVTKALDLSFFDATPTAEGTLRRIAAQTIDRDSPIPLGDVGSPPERRRLMETRLIVEDRGYVEFSVPVVREWFGAQALEVGEVSVSDLVADWDRLELWRHAIAVALGSAGEENASRILETIASADPGLAGELIRDCFPAPRQAPTRHLPASQECGRAIIRTMSAMTSSLGILGPVIGPVGDDGALFTLGVRSEGSQLVTAWSGSTDAGCEIVQLEQSYDPRSSDRWQTFSASYNESGIGWAWRCSLDHLVWRLDSILTKRGFAEGPLRDEAIWRIATRLSGRSFNSCDSIEIEDIQKILDDYGTALADARKWHPNCQLLHKSGLTPEVAASLKEALDGARRRNEVLFVHHLPTPDTVDPLHPAWPRFSPERTLLRIKCVYEQAIEAYNLIVERWFTAFRRRMMRWVTFPARLHCTVYHPDSAGAGFAREPWMALMIEAVPKDSPSEVLVQLADTAPHSTDIDPAWREIDARSLSCRKSDARYLWRNFEHRALHFAFRSDAVSHLVYDWLEKDLQRIGWTR